MKIIDEKCVNCGLCIPYCPVGAIVQREGAIVIDLEKCVECGVCLRSEACRFAAIEESSLSWPRVLRKVFSDPLTVHTPTDIAGRGTEEMKTNDVTHRFKVGDVGISIELGRPATGTSFEDVVEVCRALAEHGVQFEPKNPVTNLINTQTGQLKDPVVRKERVLSAIIEICIKQENLLKIIKLLQEVSKEINTVMSIGIITICEGDKISVKRMLKLEGVMPRINGKVNLGLALAWSYK